MTRQDREAKPGGDDLFDGFVAAKRHACRRANVVFGEKPFRRLPGPRPRLAQDELFAGQPRRRDIFLRAKRMAGRGEHDQRIFDEGDGDDIHVFRASGP